MTDAAEILVVILSVFLAVFLLLAIILTALLIKISAQIKKITSKAESVVDNLEAASRTMSKLSTPLGVAKFVFQKFQDIKKGK